MPVEGLAGPVVAHRGPWVGVAGGFLDVASGERRPVRTADRYQTVVHLNAGTLADPLADPLADSAAVTGETGRPDHGEASVEGVAVAAETVRRLCCDGSVVWLIETSDGEPVGVSAKTRTVPAGLRGALQARDRMCRFPGCSHQGWLDAHHLVRWADGGPTTLANLVLLCRRHHRAVHEGRWQISHGDDGMQFISPGGWTLHSITPTITELDLDLHVAPRTVTPNWYGDPIDIGYVTAVMTQSAAFT
ncbi:MAG: HNH endonuclease signature motif containing protein [Acidimicrobiales bacterium]